MTKMKMRERKRKRRNRRRRRKSRKKTSMGPKKLKRLSILNVASGVSDKSSFATRRRDTRDRGKN